MDGRTAASFSRTSLERPADGGIVEARGQLKILVPAEEGDVGILPLEIAVIGAVDLDLLARERRPVGDRRPNRLQSREVDFRMAEKLGQRAALAVGVQARCRAAPPPTG